MSSENDPLSWVFLQTALGAGSPKPVALAEKLGGARAVREAGPERLRQTGLLTERELSALCGRSADRAEKICADCDELGYRILTPDDADYPDRLRSIYAPPCALYVWGELPPQTGVFIAMVGTRQVTDYGYEAATQLSMGLANAGAVVVSGLAVGVDGASHRGALKAGGKTVAVVGCGLDINYPAPHTELRRLIAQNGAVVSEYPPGTRGSRAQFPMRNRIIAGLCQGTLVVEAGERSGALITSAQAAEMGRDVFAVPGSIFSPFSIGTNRLIRDGAKPVCRVSDILEEYPDAGLRTLIAGGDEAGAARSARKTAAKKLSGPAFSEAGAARLPREKLSPDEKQTPAAKQTFPRSLAGLSQAERELLGALSAQPRGMDELALSLNVELRALLVSMTALEIKGFACCLPGGRYVRA